MSATKPFTLRELKIFGSIAGGKLTIFHQDKYRENIQLFGDCEVEIDIVKKTRKRSNKQLGYYFGGVIPIIKQGLYDLQGEHFTAAEVHELLKLYCNGFDIVNTETGEIVRIGRETKSMETWQFEEYLERCRQWAKQFLNVEIQLPNQQTELKLE